MGLCMDALLLIEYFEECLRRGWILLSTPMLISECLPLCTRILCSCLACLACLACPLYTVGDQATGTCGCEPSESVSEVMR